MNSKQSDKEQKKIEPELQPERDPERFEPESTWGKVKTPLTDEQKAALLREQGYFLDED